ncbi:ATP-binding domain-containing protein [Burkholderia cepacia]|uniref:ATP-binding domain-containing protein n=1 Tax=Burkholderia cepacia TaxID=292 RepID=UPI0009BC624B|nr:ATP-binding domain-containing protein [Burkholderia cepacia]
METLLLDLMGLRQPNEHPVRTVQRIGMDRRAHRRCALGFLMSLPKACGNADADRLAWIARVHAETERLNLPLPAGVTVRNFFRRPTNARWSDHLQIALDLGLRCAKIHEAKGREYGAVCVVIPPNRAPENRGEALFESWEARTDSEAKRVLYVGLTRARHLAALAVPVAFADRCVALLAAGQVPHTRRDLYAVLLKGASTVMPAPHKADFRGGDRCNLVLRMGHGESRLPPVYIVRANGRSSPNWVRRSDAVCLA